MNCLEVYWECHVCVFWEHHVTCWLFSATIHLSITYIHYFHCSLQIQLFVQQSFFNRYLLDPLGALSDGSNLLLAGGGRCGLSERPRDECEHPGNDVISTSDVPRILTKTLD